MLTLLLLLGGGAFWYYDPRKRDGYGCFATPIAAAAIATDASIAVLPLREHERGQGTRSYFADGLSEEVLDVLSRIQGSDGGRPETSSFYYKDKSEKPDVIAATLRVNYLLEGSVRWAGPRVRITAQLIDARSGYNVWSDKFEREREDVFAIQEEIARTVAGALRVRLLPC